MNKEKIIDLRSDTVTKPTKAMLDAMFSAEVGDDVFEEDPTVKKLEEKSAALFGKEAALFCTSGTMANQIAIKVLTQPMEEIICDAGAHLYCHEGGGYAFNSGVSIRALHADRGILTAEEVSRNINPDHVHVPVTSLVCIENTSNKGGGSCYSPQQIKAIADICKKNKLHFHLDGARIFNALTETKSTPSEIGISFDTISFCLSKGLGAPAGSMFVSAKENVAKARRLRKVWGGGMRQVGFLAAAGIYALENNIERLKEDHRRAAEIGKVLSSLSYVDEVLPVETNIIVFRISKSAADFLNYLAGKNIKAVPFGEQTIRMVTHLDFNDEMLEQVLKALHSFKD